MVSELAPPKSPQSRRFSFPLHLGSWLATFVAAWTFLVFSNSAAWSVETTEAVGWYDTLGYPDARDLPYVHVATGAWSRTGNQPPENRFVEGFLVGEDAEAFTVFICSVSDFKSPFDFSEPYPPLTTVRFVRKATGPEYTQVSYEIRDFEKVVTQVLERVRAQATTSDRGLQGGTRLSHRVRIFAFARACQQKGLSQPAAELMNFAANIADEQTGQVEPEKLRDTLQRQIGEAVITKAERTAGDPAVPWAELLKVYESFGARFPASPKVAYAQESATILHQMIAEDSTHRPQPLDQMSPSEQVAENIYQLRNLNLSGLEWAMYRPYPVYTYDPATRKETITPIHRLVDLGDTAIPQLIEALDDRRFTRSLYQSFHTQHPPVDMRVGDLVQRILEHLSGRNFFPRRTDDGRLVNGTTRQQAEAWWKEKQRKGELQQLIETTESGDDQTAPLAARKLVEKYPKDALAAIEKGTTAAQHWGTRGELVQIAGTLPGDTVLSLLRARVAPGNDLYPRVRAAEALFARGQPDAIPAMTAAWRDARPFLKRNQSDIYSKVGHLIAFLARSGQLEAIEALAKDLRQTPIDVRIAVIKVFLPWPQRATLGGSGPIVSANSDPNDPVHPLATDLGRAIERLLLAELTDTEQRLEMDGIYNEVSYKDPRACDLAALTMAQLWPEKYQFDWPAGLAERNAQIKKLRERRAER